MTGPCNSIWFIVAVAADIGTLKTPFWRLLGEYALATTSLFGEFFVWLTSIWVCLLYSGTVFLLAYVVHRLRVRQIEVKFSSLLYRKFSEHARIARDLNDSLLQTIEASKLIADDALDPSIDMPHIREAMERLSNWLGQATGEGQAALKSLPVTDYDGNDLASSFRRAAEECLTQRSTKFALLVTGAHRDIHPIIRDEVYLLGYEVIRNTCQRRGIGRVEVELAYGSTFCLQVRSFGERLGFSLTHTGKEEELDLVAMRRRAQRFGGSVNVTATSASTAEFALSVPGTIVYQRVSSVLPQWFINLWRRLR